jgi:predicted RNA-binding Zn-ribbon protein involved in translation (DUF1610 family)
MTLPTPPTPLSYPPPHWLLTVYAAASSAGQMKVGITTDQLLHLCVEYTQEEPLQSNRQRWRRGMGWVRDKHWSYFPQGFIEQVEAGDTLTHTFYIPSEQSTARLWLRFAHDYITQFMCPVCGLASLPKLEKLCKQQGRQYIESRLYCSVCKLTFPYLQIRNHTASKSCTPFFPVLPVTNGYTLDWLESWYQILNYTLLFFEEFSS